MGGQKYNMNKSKEYRLHYMQKSIASQLMDLKEKKKNRKNYKVNEVGKQSKVIKERGETDGNS